MLRSAPHSLGCGRYAPRRIIEAYRSEIPTSRAMRRMGMVRSRGRISRRKTSGSGRGCCASHARISLMRWRIFSPRRRAASPPWEGSTPVSFRASNTRIPAWTIRSVRSGTAQAGHTFRPEPSSTTPHRAQTRYPRPGSLLSFGAPRRIPSRPALRLASVRGVGELRRSPAAWASLWATRSAHRATSGAHRGELSSSARAKGRRTRALPALRRSALGLVGTAAAEN